MSRRRIFSANRSSSIRQMRRVPYNYLGYMWVEQNENLDEAAQLIRRALDLEPGNGAYLDSLGWLPLQAGEIPGGADGAACGRPKRSLEPDAVDFEHIGDTCDKLGNKAEAVLYWQKALQSGCRVTRSWRSKLDKARREGGRTEAPDQTGALHKLQLSNRRDEVFPPPSVTELMDGGAAPVPVVDGQFVDVHADETVGQRIIQEPRACAMLWVTAGARCSRP